MAHPFAKEKVVSLSYFHSEHFVQYHLGPQTPDFISNMLVTDSGYFTKAVSTCNCRVISLVPLEILLSGG